MRFILRTVSVWLTKIGATLTRVAALGCVLTALTSAPFAHSQAAPPHDPKVYTQPWVALDKLPFYFQPPNLDVREMICSPSDSSAYDRLIGNPASDKGHK